MRYVFRRHKRLPYIYYNNCELRHTSKYCFVRNNFTRNTLPCSKVLLRHSKDKSLINLNIARSITSLTDKISEKPIPKKTKSELRQLLQLYVPERKQLAISFVALCVSTSITMCVPYGIGQVIDLSLSKEAVVRLPYFLSGLGMLFTIGSLANVSRVYTSNMIGERITNRIRTKVFRAILNQENAFFDTTKTGELINRLSADTTLIKQFLSDDMSQGIRSMGQSIVSVSMLFVTCPQLASIMICIVPPLAFAGVTYGRKVKALTKDVQEKLSISTAYAEESIGNISTVKWSVKEEHEEQNYARKIDAILHSAWKRSRASAVFFGTVDFSVKMSTLCVLGYGGYLVAEGFLTSGELTAFMLYTIYVSLSFANLSSFYSNAMSATGASSRLFELLQRKPNLHYLSGTAKLPNPLTGHIQFKNVYFQYPSRAEAQIFEDFNLDIFPNETIALVGSSGCGKSSLIALLARFYELEKGNGKILLDGVDIATLHPQELRSIIGAVPQEPPLFARSIRDNIAYGSMKPVTLEEIIYAAQQANAHDFIMSFPETYDTIMNERGLSLSGGQKQRIAIARALIKDPKILILDEATSALDIETELFVQQAIQSIQNNRTVLLIAHRLSTIKAADRIAVIHNKKIGECGTLQELSSNPKSLFTRTILHRS